MKIKYEDYLKAFALFNLANTAQREVDKYEAAMNSIFNEDNGSHLSDAVYTYNSKGDIAEFNNALTRMGCSIPKPPGFK